MLQLTNLAKIWLRSEPDAAPAWKIDRMNGNILLRFCQGHREDHGVAEQFGDAPQRHAGALELERGLAGSLDLIQEFANSAAMFRDFHARLEFGERGQPAMRDQVQIILK